MLRTDIKPARFHFALPRLFTQLAGGESRPVETNWLEANVVGTAVMSISYFAVRRWILGGAGSIERELLFVIPLLLVTWIFWLLALYVDALIIRLLRMIGLLTGGSDAEAQSVFVALITTAFALQLTGERGWPRRLGWLWIAAVAANLLAALLLTFISRTRDGK
ncbi:MAG: hypothetical protein ABR526_00275 [Chthoniobacterales bacterium]